MESERKTRVIAIGNQKGGVGKTTNAVNLAAALGERGKLCLVWDLDMNHNATKHFGVPPDSFLGTFEVLIGAERAEDVILKAGDVENVHLPMNVHLLPAKRKLEAIAKVLAEEDKFQAPQNILIEPLRQLRGKYDYIILDTAPNATPPTVASYMAADYFILSAIPERWAIDGLADALKDLQSAQRRGNERLRLLGVIVGAVDRRTRLAIALTEYVEEAFAGSKFDTTIGRSTVVSEAQDVRKTIFQTAPTHAVTEQYRELAREVEARIAAIEGGTEQGSILSAAAIPVMDVKKEVANG